MNKTQSNVTFIYILYNGLPNISKNEHPTHLIWLENVGIPAKSTQVTDEESQVDFVGMQHSSPEAPHTEVF